MKTADLQKIANATTEILRETDLELMRSVFRLMRLLLDGEPISAEQFAASIGVTRDEAEAIFGKLQAWGAEFDEKGNFVGAGLTLVATPYRYEADGHHFYTWCASDAILFPLIFGHTAVLDSLDPESGERVRVMESPAGIEQFAPTTAVLSSRCGGMADDVRGSICQYGHFFTSRETAAAYVARHEGLELAIVTPDEAFQLAQILVAQEPLRSISKAM